MTSFERELQDEIDGLNIDLVGNVVTHPKYGDMTLMVMAELELNARQRKYDAANAQRAIAAENHRTDGLLPFRFGRTVAQIDEQDYADQERLEPGCWKDPNFVRDYVKHNPAAGVKTRSKTGRIIV